MRVQIVFNPGSGHYSPRLVAAVARAFERRGATVTTTATGDAPPAVSAEADHVVVVGGDGTVRHVAHVLARMDAPPRLSVYPGGTVNLLAREWPGRHRPAAFAARVAGRTERARFAVEWEGGSFLCCAGAGWESAAVAAVDPRLKRVAGRFAYAVAAARLMLRWRPTPITLVADDRTIRCEGFHIAKGVHYAGRWRLAGQAFGHEPVMQLVALTRARRRDLARFWWALLRGRPVGELPRVIVVECRTLVASADAAMPVQADGDLIGTLPMTFIVARRAITTC